MFPYLTFLGRTYPSLAVLGLVGFFVASFVAGFRTQRYGLVRSDPLYIGAFAGLGVLGGSVLLFAITQIPFVVENWGDFNREFFMRVFGGMVFYGGLFGAVAGLYVYCKFMRLSFDVAMKLAIPVFPLAHAFMRVGCFAGGCCHGMEFPPPLGIAFSRALGAPNGIPLLPVQLYESGVNLLIFAALWWYTRKERDGITLACVYGVLYSFARFWLEFLRGDEVRGFVFGLSTSQLISVLLFPVCVVVIVRRHGIIK